MRRCRRSGIAGLAALWLVACGTGSEERGPAARLVPETEIAELKRSLMAALAENRTRSCRRPVLRGEALEGRADDDIRAVFEPTGDLAACLEAAGAEEVREALATFPPVEPGDEPRTGTARPIGDPASLTPAIRQIDERCAMLPAAIARAVGHEDACSPYLPGRNPQPSLRSYLRACRAVAIRARHLAEQGQVAAAVRLVLDAIRLGQDASRGGPSLILAMIAVAGAEILLPQAELFLRTGTLPPDEVALLASELDALIASEVHWSELLRGEQADMALYMVLPHLERPGWIPPGGWPYGMGPPAETDGPLKTKSLGIDPRDEQALGWVALDETSRAKLAACPASATLETCVAALGRVSADRAAAASKLRLPEIARDPTKAIRGQVLAILEGIAAPADAKYARRHARRLARLAAMRLHVEARRAPTCPAARDHDRPPFLELRRPAALGGTLGIAPAASGVDVITPPWLGGPSPLWEIRCP